MYIYIIACQRCKNSVWKHLFLSFEKRGWEFITRNNTVIDCALISSHEQVQSMDATKWHVLIHYIKNSFIPRLQNDLLFMERYKYEHNVRNISCSFSIFITRDYYS